MSYTAIPTSGGATLATLTGLTNKQIVFGASDGTATSSADATFDDSTNDLNVSAFESGGTVGFLLENTSNTASSAARANVRVAGSTADDAAYQVSVSGGQSYTWGIDNSVSGDPFVFSASSALGTTDVFSINSVGEVGFGGAPVTSSQFLIQGTGAMSGGIITSAGTTVSGAFWRVGTGTTRVIRIGGYGPTESGNTTYGEPKNNTAEISTTSLTQLAILTGTSTLQCILDNGKPGISVVPTGVQRCWVGGTIKTIQSDTGNVGAGEDTLHTYTLPASMLSADGMSIVVETVFSFAANANSKQAKVFFGGTAVYASGAQVQNGGALIVRARITRTGAATQRAYALAVNDAGTPLFADTATYSEPAETLSGTIVIKTTGEGVNDNDIVSKVTRIYWEPALN